MTTSSSAGRCSRSASTTATASTSPTLTTAVSSPRSRRPTGTRSTTRPARRLLGQGGRRAQRVVEGRRHAGEVRRPKRRRTARVDGKKQQCRTRTTRAASRSRRSSTSDWARRPRRALRPRDRYSILARSHATQRHRVAAPRSGRRRIGSPPTSPARAPGGSPAGRRVASATRLPPPPTRALREARH